MSKIDNITDERLDDLRDTIRTVLTVAGARVLMDLDANQLATLYWLFCGDPPGRRSVLPLRLLDVPGAN